MISLSLRIAPLITGFVHVQTNPAYAYSTSETVENARRKPFILQEETQTLQKANILRQASSVYLKRLLPDLMHHEFASKSPAHGKGFKPAAC